MYNAKIAMITAALITAAGRNTNLNTPGPFLGLNSRTFLEHSLQNLAEAGVTVFTVITGYQHSKLEKFFAGQDIIFLQNKDYETTDMFASVRIGLEYLENKCDRLFILPADVPLLSPEPLKKLLSAEGMAVVPVHDGKSGHPLLLKASGIPCIFKSNPACGLEQAVKECFGTPEMIEVEQPAVTVDINTMDDYKELIKLERTHELKRGLKINNEFFINKGDFSFSSETADFIRLAGRSGSMQTASRILNISYTKCWQMIKDAESNLGIRFLEKKPGGPEGGSSEITAEGIRFLKAYQAVKTQIEDDANSAFRRHFKEWL